MAKQTTRAGMDVKEKMYLVLVLCFAAVLITVGAAFFIVRGLGSTTRQNDNTADSAATQEPLVADSSYDKNQNTIDTNKYSSTILEESADAGQSYVDETLFLGDSNTARMYRGGLHGNYCTKIMQSVLSAWPANRWQRLPACSSRATAATRRCRKRLP